MLGWGANLTRDVYNKSDSNIFLLLSLFMWCAVNVSYLFLWNIY